MTQFLELREISSLPPHSLVVAFLTLGRLNRDVIDDLIISSMARKEPYICIYIYPSSSSLLSFPFLSFQFLRPLCIIGILSAMSSKMPEREKNVVIIGAGAAGMVSALSPNFSFFQSFR